ncbi:MAG: hypothetical protein A2W93_01490 [Bacteroidetes bacterium GWF2_43_63]|nr:MAG: hypothetical protein A2W94_10580 [Bacteroidetes bacterium GWE2_42_42]OFY55743.1 MAG: hypothetical protein A2W93_01490 [Bacteroidetes bacterium GWF2_43_63]HBG71344.1 hypothetical protein [Bacteroidales bacterium]HCB60436.1 hypothetical protein [Bacteroidales bacterium]HCY22607.1 hypothetical protein [Bacteroidales bacterium]
MKQNNSPVSLFLFLLLAAYLVISNLMFFPNQIICYDVYGYYLYLPQTFIYNDLSIHNFDQVNSLLQQYGNSSTFYQASMLEDGTYVMKYSMGMAILFSPFFFIAHFLAPYLGYAADGYSFPYQFSLLIGGILYSIAGLWFLGKVLLKYLSDRITAITLLLIVIATNFLPHIGMYGQNAMSHNYLFALYCMALWFTVRWHETFRLKFIVFLGLVCGLAILSRPTEIVILAIPALWSVDSWKALQEKFKTIFNHFGQMAVFGFIVLALGFCQLLYWKLHTGHFLYYSYGSNPGEGMEFFSPYITEVLFSFRKGWLIYTPIMILAFSGFIVLFNKNRKIFWALLAYSIFNLYLVSCWSTWWYAQSYSQRSLVPALAVMSIPLGFFLTWVAGRKIILKSAISLVIVFLVFLNIFQIWQFHVGILDGDRMTREYYFSTFLSTSVSDKEKELLLIDRRRYEINNFDNEQEYKSTLNKQLSFEDDTIIDSVIPADGQRYCLIDSASPYTPVIEIPYSELTKKDHAWLRVRAKIFPVTPPDSLKVALVLHFSHKGFPYQYRTIESPRMELKPGVWNEVKFDYLTPEVRNKSDIFRTFVWNMAGGSVLVDQLSLEVFEPTK